MTLAAFFLSRDIYVSLPLVLLGGFVELGAYTRRSRQHIICTCVVEHKEKEKRKRTKYSNLWGSTFTEIYGTNQSLWIPKYILSVDRHTTDLLMAKKG